MNPTDQPTPTPETEEAILQIPVELDPTKEELSALYLEKFHEVQEIKRDLAAAIAEREKLRAKSRVILDNLLQRFSDEYQELTDGEYGSIEDFCDVKAARSLLSTLKP